MFVVAAAYAAKIGGVSIVKIRQHRQHVHDLEIKEAEEILENTGGSIASSSTLTVASAGSPGTKTSDNGSLGRIRASLSSRSQETPPDATPPRGNIPRKRSFRWRRPARQRSLREETASAALFAAPSHPTEMDGSQAEDIQWMWLEESRLLEQQQREQVQQFKQKQAHQKVDRDETTSTSSNDSSSSMDTETKKDLTTRNSSIQDESEQFFDCQDCQYEEMTNKGKQDDDHL